MQRTDGGEGHCATPCSGVVARMLRTVSGQKHPSFSESHRAIKLDEIISILTFEIARGTGYQHGPGLVWIKIRRCCEHSECVWRHGIPTLCSQRFFLRAQGNISLNG